MLPTEIARYRLYSQRLAAPLPGRVEDVVAYMGAMQAQDYHHAKWAVGVRLPAVTDAEVEQAVDEGRILRTHVLRPTWHLVSPQDIRWMLALSGPQVVRMLGSLERYHGLEAAFYRRAFSLIERALTGSRHLTRKELMAELAEAGIQTNPSMATLIMYRAELSALVCSGARKGRDLTYALLDERVPRYPVRSRAEAIAELAERYFRSHGPAALEDFQWWSGLNKGDARAGLEAAQPGLVRQMVDGRAYWFPEGLKPDPGGGREFHLLPAFDEFLISYTDRTAALPPERAPEVVTKNAIFKPLVVSGGQVVGIWSRDLKKRPAGMERRLFSGLSPEQEEAYAAAARRYAAFLG